MAKGDAIRALIAGLGAGARDLSGSMRERAAQRASAEAGLLKLAREMAMDDAQLAKLKAETLKLLQVPERQPPQTISPGQGLLGADGKYTVPIPEAPRQSPQEPLVEIVGPNGKPVLVRRGQAEGKQLYHPPRETAPARLPATAVNDLAELDALMGQGREVAQALAGAVRNKTNATGRVGGLLPTPTFVKEFVGQGGKEGSNVRDAISNLFATIAKQRGGSALSASEIALLERYVPNENDDESRALMKSNRFVRELDRIKRSKVENFRKAGYGSEPATPDAAPLPNPEY